MTTEYRVLGDTQARVDGQLVELGHNRQRCVLAVLLVDANHSVSTEQLVDRVWAQHAPRRARETLYGYLHRLRRVLGDDQQIIRRSGGYVLSIDPMAVDLHRFRQLVTQARTTEDDTTGLPLWEQALGLWRGKSFTGLDTPWINGVRDTMEAERLAAELDYTDVALRTGWHQKLVVDMSARAVHHPLDERVTGQLMLALYLCGRQADALNYYQQTRSRLAEELGTDPSRPLQQLQHRILVADPTLAAPRTRATVAHSPVPRQLPAGRRMFVGRTDELVALTDALDAGSDDGVLVAIAGAAGIGKTWLALHWAHRNSNRFPDGQLYVNLRGFGPSGQPMLPTVALGGFLGALGVPAAAIPVDLDTRAVRFRGLVMDKRMLIVLDNAADTAQVVPLIPWSTTSMVVVTSRNKLTSLVAAHGVRPLPLYVLDEREAREQLTRHLGTGRLGAEPEAVNEMLRHCGSLPLAVGVIAARAATSPDAPLAALAEELGDHTTRLDALDTGEADLSVRSVFSWSYQHLEPETARVFGLLGLAPGPDINLSATASLTGQPPAQVRMTLRGLECANLISQPVWGRYRMHDLVRLYAAEQAVHDIPRATREAALRRVIDYYLHTAAADERANLLAAQRLAADLGWYSTVRQVAHARHRFRALSRSDQGEQGSSKVCPCLAVQSGPPDARPGGRHPRS